MQVLPRARLALARHPALYWIMVGAVAVAVGLAAGSAMRRVDTARRSWGRTVPVWVATAGSAPGESLHVQRLEYPVAMVPAAAVTISPEGLPSIQSVTAGEIVVAGDVAESGLAALVPAGWLAMAVPAHPGEHLQLGAHVAAFAAGVQVGAGSIVALDDQQVVIAVPAGDAPALSAAITGGTVVLALAG